MRRIYLLDEEVGISLSRMTIIHDFFFVLGEGPRGRSYERTTALRLVVQPCDEDEEKGDQFLFFHFPSNGAPVE
jgi:hypothetical protein